MTDKQQRHSWSDKVRYPHHSERACWDCGLIKRTRHEVEAGRDVHWVEWWRDGKRIRSDRTPPCPGPKPIQQVVSEMVMS